VAVALPRSRMPQPQRHDPFAGGAAGGIHATLVAPVIRTGESISAALP
jgi:hypothetical protein